MTPMSISTSFPAVAAATTAVVALLPGAVMADTSTCKPIGDIYRDGTQMCETMWDEAFEVVDDSADGYTMYFYDEVNPNDAVSAKRGLTSAKDTCFIKDTNHKLIPGPENLNECGAYRGNACCKEDSVASLEKVKGLYGAEYHWDRCGPLSRECEAFFVQEACFYECDLNNGYWRKYADPKVGTVDGKRVAYNPKCNPSDASAYDDIDPESNDSPTGEKYVDDNPAICGSGHNRWQLYKAPIKRSYCSAWYDACKNDLFCGADGGSYFSCARIFEATDKKNGEIIEIFKLSTGVVAGIVVASCLVVFFVIMIIVMAVRERRGRPVFQKILEDDEVVGME